MNWIISRYIFVETAIPFLLGMTVFTFVLLMGRLVKLVEMVFAKGVPLLDVLKLITYLLPSFFIMTIPMAFLLAVLLAFGRLSADSEITAMKASGVGVGALFPPVLAFATLAYLVTTFVSVYALPWGNNSFKQFLYEEIQSRASVKIEDGVFNDDFPGIMLYVDRIDQHTREMQGILIQDERNPAQPYTIFASTGRIVGDPEDKTIRFHLEKGSIHQGERGNEYRLAQFQGYDLHVSLERQAASRKTNEQEMSISQLRQLNDDTHADPKLRCEAQMEIHKRLALPFACFVFALIGVPLGIQNQRSGKAGGFAAALCLILLYYLLLSAGKTVGERGVVPPSIAVWTPNLMFLMGGFYLLRLSITETPLPLSGTIRELKHRLQEWLVLRRKGS